MTKTPAEDREKLLSLLRAAVGDFDLNKPLSKLISQVPDFGRFEWMLTVIGIEIDLRVDIPESIADDLKQTANKFCSRVLRLPKVDSPGYTLECLGLVAQALLSLDTTTESAGPAKRKKVAAPKPLRKRSAAQTTARATKKRAKRRS